MERIYEMTNRRKRQTRLPINIWIDENGRYKLSGHGKRIKVQMNYGEKMQNHQIKDYKIPSLFDMM